MSVLRPDASCLLSLLGRLLVVSLIASTREDRESVVMARGPCRTHAHTHLHTHPDTPDTPDTLSPCTLAPLMEWRFDAVTPVLRHVLQHPSQGAGYLKPGHGTVAYSTCTCACIVAASLFLSAALLCPQHIDPSMIASSLYSSLLCGICGICTTAQIPGDRVCQGLRFVCWFVDAFT